MNFISLNKRKRWVLGLTILLTAAGCSKDDDQPSTGGSTTDTQGSYVIAAAVSGTGTYFITANSLDTGTVTIVGQGIENPKTYSHYILNGTSDLVAINYGGGSTSYGTGYSLTSGGALQEIGNGFTLPDGFVTAGSVGNYVITLGKASVQSDSSVSFPVYYVDAANNNYVTSKTFNTQNLMGNGLAVSSLVGVADAGNGQFFAGVQLTNGDPDSIYVVKLDTALNVIQTYKDSRLSYSGSAWRSARYAQIGNDDNGNTYVFSAGYSPSTKHSGALKIDKGASTFDAGYYFDIQTAAGGYQIRRLWHADGDYFLLEMFNETDAGNQTAGTQYAIVNMATQDFKWVSGLPAKENIYIEASSGATSVGWPFMDSRSGKFYMTLKDVNVDNPQFYSINLATATATAGVKVIGATTIPASGYLTY